MVLKEKVKHRRSGENEREKVAEAKNQNAKI
jgi:hypothetical protein